ncbi:MAG TPA: VTT domain-containing protein [Pyrinomonadaceae bacterium]|nr:VTT domain-containing protein [Pyrinomonadaceae bacterium]
MTPARRLLLVIALGAAALVIYYKLGLTLTPERLREAGLGGWLTAGAIILAMAAAWALALPASAFFFVTPLLFPPHVSALITTAGCAAGTAAGYAVARYVGGPWVERFRDGRLHRFLSRHSSFLVLFGMRLAPGGPHGFVNYAAGLAAIPFARFVGATTLALSIKSYVYALAVHNTVGARSLSDALSARTMLSLLALALLALAGHVMRQRYARAGVEDDATPASR